MTNELGVHQGDWFVEPALWADMDRWHREVGVIRRSRSSTSTTVGKRQPRPISSRA